MSKVVIGGRIPEELMQELKKIEKTPTEILNEALTLYLSHISNVNGCLHHVNTRKDSEEYILLCKTLDSLKWRYNRFLVDSDKKEKKELKLHE